MNIEMYKQAFAGKTLADLYLAITSDYQLQSSEKQQLIDQIKGVTGNAPEYSPLSSLMYAGLGGTLSNLIAKYFGLGFVGRAVVTLAGAGIGRTLYNQFNKPKEEFTGYSRI